MGKKVKAILQTQLGGGSGFGISFWKSWMGCSMKAWFAEREAERRKARGEPAPLPTAKALLVGTVVHAFLEIYYKMAMRAPLSALRLDTTAVSFVDDAGYPCDVAEDAHLDAETMFRAYRTVYAPDELGEIVDVEGFLAGPVVESAIECSPFTLKYDAAIKLDKSDCKRLLKTRYLKLDPGYYLVDHKTAAPKPWTDQMFMDEVQFTAYQLAYQHVYPKRSLRGLIVNILLKNKRPEFRSLLVPFPSPSRVDVLKNFLRQAQERREYASGHANITHCYGYEPCAYRAQCPRI